MSSKLLMVLQTCIALVCDRCHW